MCLLESRPFQPVWLGHRLERGIQESLHSKIDRCTAPDQLRTASKKRLELNYNPNQMTSTTYSAHRSGLWSELRCSQRLDKLLFRKEKTTLMCRFSITDDLPDTASSSGYLSGMLCPWSRLLKASTRNVPMSMNTDDSLLFCAFQFALSQRQSGPTQHNELVDRMPNISLILIVVKKKGEQAK